MRGFTHEDVWTVHDFLHAQNDSWSHRENMLYQASVRDARSLSLEQHGPLYVLHAVFAHFMR